MNKYKKSIYALVAAAIVSGTAMVSCSEPGDVQDLVLDRILSPTGVESRVTSSNDIVLAWNSMSGASQYEVQAFEETEDYANATAAITHVVTNVAETVADTLTDLKGETTYYIRIRSVDAANESRNSKWYVTSKTTNAEQKMDKVKSANIKSDAVTLTWLAGIDVDKIVLTPNPGTAGSSSQAVTYDLTAENKAAGSATVTGLTPETTYQAILQLNGKTRGYQTFTTNIDLSDGTVYGPEDNWQTAISSAASGAKIVLKPGVYTATDKTSAIKISSNITIAGQNSADLPVINAYFTLHNSASVMFYQVKLNGEGLGSSADGKVQCVEYKDASVEYGALTFKGCEVYNYVKGFIYNNVASSVKSISIDDCTIHDVVCDGGDFIDFRKSPWESLSLTNSTIYNTAAKRSLLRLDDSSSSYGAIKPDTKIDHCTFYNVGNSSEKQMMFYIRFGSKDVNTNTFTNNVVVGYTLVRGFTNQSKTGAISFSNNLYYNCANLQSQAEGNTVTPTQFDSEKATVLTADPFKDAANADFTIAEEAIAAKQAGNPLWY